jgi:MFS family permease
VRDAAPDPGRLRWAMLALLFVCRTSLGFQFQAMGSTAPRVAAEFGLNLAETGTLIGLFMLPGLFLALPSGYAGRHVSDRRLLAIGLLVMGLGGVLAALAAGFGWLALARIGRVHAGVAAARRGTCEGEPGAPVRSTPRRARTQGQGCARRQSVASLRLIIVSSLKDPWGHE